MIEDTVLRSIIDSQAHTGAFPSFISFEGKRFLDWNGFTTAHVLRALRDVPESHHLNNSKHLALDFLKKCESPEKPGTFCFWPKDMQSGWRPELPPDADDTAIYLVEMLRNKYIDIRAARKTVLSVLLPFRLMEIPDQAPLWIRKGAFPTWLCQDPVNIVDCCVNANIIALLSYIGLDDLECFDEICEMIEEGIRWSQGSSIRVRTLTPVYPHPAEFACAVEFAIDCGAKQLEESLKLMVDLGWVQNKNNETYEEIPICSFAYSQIVWYSQILDIARKFGKMHSSKTKSDTVVPIHPSSECQF